MKKKLVLRSVLIILVIGICVYVLLNRSINTGLDIQGGTHFTIEAILDDVPEIERQDAVDRMLAVYRNRIDEIGVAGTSVEQSGKNRIIVQIPGIETKETKRIRDILLRQAHLEFKLVIDGPGEPVVVN